MSFFYIGRNELQKLIHEKEAIDSEITSIRSQAKHKNVFSFQEITLQKKRKKIENKLNVMQPPGGDDDSAA